MRLRSLSEEEADYLCAVFHLRLDPSAFNHRGHLYLGWLLLQSRPPEEACRLCAEGIEAFAAHIGVAKKFDADLTQTFMERMIKGGATDPTLSFEAFLMLNPDLTRRMETPV